MALRVAAALVEYHTNIQSHSTPGIDGHEPLSRLWIKVRMGLKPEIGSTIRSPESLTRIFGLRPLLNPKPSLSQTRRPRFIKPGAERKDWTRPGWARLDWGLGSRVFRGLGV